MQASTSQRKPYQPPEAFTRFSETDPATQVRLANLLSKPESEQTPQERQYTAEIKAGLEEIRQMPISSLPPRYHSTHELAVKLHPYMHGIVNEPPRELAEECQAGEKRGIERCLMHAPQYAAIQAQIDQMLQQINFPGRFNLPAWLNAIAQQLNRPKPFLLVNIFTPKNELMMAQIKVVRNARPIVHMAFVKLLVRASLLAQEPHPKQCTCLLCAHVASLGITNASGYGSSI